MLAAGATSPRDQIQIVNAPPRPSPTSTVRSVPSVSAPQTTSSQPEQWQPHPSYRSAGSSPMAQPASGLQDVPAPPDAVRWSPHAHQVSTSLPMHTENLQAVDHGVSHPMNYPYVLDHSGRPMQYPLEQQPMAYTQPTSNPTPPPPPPQDYQQRHLSVQMPTSTPAYRSYPHPQGYMPTTTSHSGEGMQMMAQQPMENPHMMYGMPGNMKVGQ